MCGIFGFSGKQAVDVTKIRWLAVENKSRGTHSTGIYVIKGNKQQEKLLVKNTKAADIFINDQEVEKALPGALTVQGHTRAATVGAVSAENAHPFLFDYTKIPPGALVVGAHNGYVLDDIFGDKQFKHFGFEKPFDVDSMLIFATLAKDGNYDRLGKIEGGIACSFQFPEKHNRDLFLYRASGRELHFGLASEGIYYSSEREPLTFIGCRKVEPVPDNTVFILRDGEILDMQKIEGPKIKMPHGAKRHDWHTSIPDSKLRECGLDNLTTSKSTSIYNRNNANFPATKPASTTQTTAVTSYSEKIGFIIEDIKKIVADLVPIPKEFTSTISYQTGDTDSCFLAIKLRSTTGNAVPLPGWAIFSEQNNKVRGVTHLNGVTLLRFLPPDCGKEHTLKVVHPIEPANEQVFTVTFTPEKTSVMEVTLDLPFPQTEKNKTTGSSVDSKEKAEANTAGLGHTNSDVQISGLAGGRGLFSDTSKTSKLLPESSKSLRERYKKEQDDGQQAGFGREKETTSRDSNVRKEQYSAAGGSIPAMPSPESCKQLIAKENHTFEFDTDIKRFTNSAEYAGSLSLWTRAFGNDIKVKQLFHDACVIKFHNKKHFQNSLALPVYCRRLVTVWLDNYIVEENMPEGRKNFLLKRILAVTNGDLPKLGIPEVDDAKKTLEVPIS